MLRHAILLPPWAAGLWVLLASDSVWDPASSGPNLHGDTLAAGWMVVGTLVVGTVLYAGAPVFGRKLFVSSPSSALVGLDEPNALQASLGGKLVRGAAVLVTYALVGGFAVAFG